MGTYVLALFVGAPRSILVGRLGEFAFPVGWYLYVGSAFGPGGLRARLERHLLRLADGKRPHWHVDHLREGSIWGGAWVRSSEQRLECEWATAMRRLPDAQIVAPRFGASDCHCPAHLVRVSSLPNNRWFAAVLGAARVSVRDGELEELLKVLTTGDDEAREQAAVALGSLEAQAVERLAILLQNDDVDTRWWAARALAETGESSAVLPLGNALDDVDPDVRACAALALGRIGDGRAAPVLVACLADQSPFVASVAADALSMIGEPAVEALAQMLTADSPHVRLLAVRALARVRSQKSIGPLFGALEDPSYLVRYYAQETLEALGVGMVLFAP
jgi:Uri superfamily endonuclease